MHSQNQPDVSDLGRDAVCSLLFAIERGGSSIAAGGRVVGRSFKTRPGVRSKGTRGGSRSKET